MSELQILDALCQDSVDVRQTIDNAEKGSLILRDLGYFHKKVFGEIMSKDTYFLSRFKPESLLYALKNCKHGKALSNELLVIAAIFFSNENGLAKLHFNARLKCQ